MTANEPQDAPKKSVYPIDAEMTVSGNKVVVKIVRLDPRGFMAYTTSGVCHVGIHYQCQIALKSAAAPLQAQGQVYKTYDAVNPSTGAVNRIVEVLFVKLSEADKSQINAYVKPAGPIG